MNMFGFETAEETHAAEQAAKAAQAAEILSGAWIVVTHHNHCTECADLVDAAVAHAKVTGSVGATYNVERAGETHGASVTYETHAERRAALKLGEDS